MAPERLSDAAQTDPRSDIFAVGAVGYFLLVGKGPFDGENQIAVIRSVLETQPDLPSQLVSIALPPGLEELLMACLAKDAADRPQSMRAIQESLETIAVDWTQADARACVS